MADTLYFDAFTCIGPRVRKHPAHAWRLTDVLAEMDHCSISGALVASTMSVQYDPMYSNLELSAQLALYPHLFPIWNVMPHQTGEFPEPRRLGRLLREHNVRAVSIHPASNAWDLFSDHSVALLRWFEKRRNLVILARKEFSGYGDLDRLLGMFPGLPVLLTGATWREQRYVLPLLTKHRNLHLSFDHFQINYGIEDLVAGGHEDQMVFASNAPQMAMGAHRCYIDYADVPQETKEKIASGNLIRLLGGQKLPGPRVNSDEDSLMAAARRGEPLPVPVIDMHMHILHEGMNGGGGAFRMAHGGPAGTFRRLKRLGVVGGGFMSWNGTVGMDSAPGNDCVRAALDTAPPGYWGLATFDPVHYSQDELRKMIPAVYGDPRFIGMKPYVMAGVEYHHRSYDLWWQYGERHGLYAGIHRNRNDFLEVSTLAKKYPRVRWVVYHCGADYATAAQSIECMREHANVYAEITLTPVTHGIVDYLVEHAGADRILYGSDLPMRDPRQQLGWVVFSRLRPEEKIKVLAGNACHVLESCLRRLPAYNNPFLKPKDGRGH